MSTATSETLEHEIGTDGLLALRVRSGDISIRAVDGDIVRVRDTNGGTIEEQFEIEAAAGSLSLSTIVRGLEFILGSRNRRRRHMRHDPDLEIDLPRRATLVLEGASSDVKVIGLLGDQRYRTASGDVELEAVSGTIEVEAVSGDIDIRATGDAQVSARSVSGDIALRAATVSRLQLGTTSGDTKVAGRFDGPGPFAIETVSGDGLLAVAGDARIEMTTVAGDLKTDVGGQETRGHGQRSLVIGTSGPIVTFRSMSGDLRVVRPVPVEAVGPPASPRRAAPQPPIQPIVPPAPEEPTSGAIAAAYDEARLRILRSLERGEIDVAEADRRLEQLDAGDIVAYGADRTGG